jgi:hypothetical protein
LTTCGRPTTDDLSYPTLQSCEPEKPEANLLLKQQNIKQIKLLIPENKKFIRKNCSFFDFVTQTNAFCFFFQKKKNPSLKEALIQLYIAVLL